MSESTVCIELFLRWLNEARERRFQLAETTERGAIAADGEMRLAVEVRPLLGEAEGGVWRAARERLEEQLGEGLPGAYALWLPYGAELPLDEPSVSEFIDAVRQAAVRLGPHERSHVPFPATLTLRKSSDGGGVVSVSGGLNAHWARFTDLVRGTFDLDSTQLHSLPESETHLEELIERIAEASRGLEAGERVEIETIDAWTIQRLDGEGGVSIIGCSPALVDDPGLAVRRNFRRILADTGPRLRETEADLRALILVGYYPRMEQEGASTAMRGYDPSLYSGIEFVSLVADGLVKPIIDSPVGAKP